MGTSLDGHKARKRFGQNFLVDSFWIDKLARAVGAKPGDDIVEIGPGKAALTRHLLDGAGKIRAVEIDRDLAAWLRSEFPESLTLIEADALTIDWKDLAEKSGHLRIVGNLPYNISSPLLLPCFRQPPAFSISTLCSSAKWSTVWPPLRAVKPTDACR